MRPRALIAQLLCLATLAGACSTASKEERREPSSTTQESFPPDDIWVGMTKAQVIDAWGQPQEIFIAGDPRLENEKWVYYIGLSSQLGKANARSLYFEGGRVSGWDTAHRPVVSRR